MRPVHIVEIDLTITPKQWKHEMIIQAKKPYYILTCIDQYTKYAECEICTGTESNY